MKIAILITLTLLSVTNLSFAQDDDAKLMENYKEILSGFLALTCDPLCIMLYEGDPIRQYCECDHDVLVGHKMDDANIEFDSLFHFGNLMTNLLTLVSYKEQELKSRLNKYDLMMTNLKAMIDKAMIKISYIENVRSSYKQTNR